MPSKETPRIDRATLTFISDLEKHNDREWFETNRARYLTAQANVQGFVDALISRMNRHDRIATENGKESLMRIFRDLRFSKDKSPYNVRFAGGISRVKPDLRGGYFFHLQPGRSFIACGFFGPEPADLKRIRVDIAQDHAAWKKLLSNKAIKTNFGELYGDKLQTAPKGFPKDHPGDDLLRRKQFLLKHTFADKEVLAPDFAERVDAIFKSVRPWFDHMSEVLTTDENGISLLRGRR